MIQSKKLRLFIVVMIGTGSPLLSDIGRLTPAHLGCLADKMVVFHEPTSSSDCSFKPDVSRFKDELLVAKMDSFGLDRYFTFKNNDDVDQLVRAVQQGGGMDLSWYYVKPEDTVCIMTLDEWKKSSSFGATTETIASKNCDIKGLDKITVVRALWKASLVAPAAKRFTPDLAAQTDISDTDISQALKRGYIDYLNCRLMKVDLSKDSFDADSYNRGNGQGAAERIIATLRDRSAE